VDYCTTIGWIVWALGVYGAILMSSIVRERLVKGSSPTPPTIFWLLYWWIILIVFLFVGWNKLHILWLIPLFLPFSFLVAVLPVICHISAFFAMPLLVLITIGCKTGVRKKLDEF